MIQSGSIEPRMTHRPLLGAARVIQGNRVGHSICHLCDEIFYGRLIFSFDVLTDHDQSLVTELGMKCVQMGNPCHTRPTPSSPEFDQIGFVVREFRDGLSLDPLSAVQLWGRIASFERDHHSLSGRGREMSRFVAL